MSKKICIAQSVEELKFILSKVNEPVICVPLNLQTQLYCIKKKLEFYNPLNFIDNNFHKNALIESENLINQLSFGDLIYESHIKVYTAIIRFRFNSAVFLIELIEKINLHEKINEIFVSGWSSYLTTYSPENYFVSHMISNLITDIQVVKLSENNEQQISSREEHKYEIQNTNLSTEKNYILVNTLGYNFTRIVFWLPKKNYYILVPNFQKHLVQKNLNLVNNTISFLKKKLFQLFKIIIVECNVLPSKVRSKFLLPDVNFFYKAKDLSYILSFRKEQEIGSLIRLRNLCEGIDDLFDNIKIKLVLTNLVRGIGGYYIDKSEKEKIPSVCIPHSTVSEYFDKFDRIFKKIIAEVQFGKKSKFFAVQSKIAKDFVRSYKINNNQCIETGNLIFADSKKNTDKKKILFAVTLKDFDNIQYLGYEMYYEFLDNLKFLNSFAVKKNLKILVKPHPVAYPCFDELKNTFKNLEFTKKKIDNALKYAFVTISFSSSVIEDSLYSKVPVILLDRWKRYKHCSAEENVKKKNSAVYYVNNENDLIECINTVRNSENISFEDYIIPGDVKTNIKNLAGRIL